ncbi:MAG TPA: SDR family oxidoreductase [Vicinamibacterales bacterium]|jgi:nucleoside-diphosphate-sugar epimerase|nr:nucleoside-diphosphate sugar epimerase [Acidobacteriota bacterium]HCV26012.1 nucleoside-diphosphate sugar epimerase [Candidatus Latescibacterota bacterium]HJO39514.1 SDR family oxidoreductase [Vicinamibacterales bacterium]|tara:strand:- start:11145 stop:12098 length:954 start_codon:yes stop_codon:yes gene_type:complete
MTKLLVTGALGHIGSRFVRQLEPAVFEAVSLLDNLSTQRYGSLFDLPTGTGFRFFEEDVCTANLDDYLDGVDVVVHLAAITDAESSVSIPEATERTNFGGTERVARACARSGSRLIFLSTTSVYGPQGGMVDEGSGPDVLRPQSPYAESKLRAERLLQEIGETQGLRFVICRFGTIFGTSPGMRFHTAINKFVWQACTGKPLTIWRTAVDQMRPYLDLGDAVAALNFILREQLFDGQVYNVLTLNATIGQIVGTISSYLPDVAVEYVDSPIMNQLSYEVSNRRFMELGFEFKGDLDCGIRETVQLLAGLGAMEELSS